MPWCRRLWRTPAALILWLALTAGAHAQDNAPCPKGKGWTPPPEQLQATLRAHQEWLAKGDPADPGRANFCNVNLIRAQLNGANLNRAQLNGAKLNRAELNGASLFGANLNEADLAEANLVGAKLGLAQMNGAQLMVANLDEADLIGAQLNGANLSYAQLNGAQLNGAQLNGAKLFGAKLDGANLSYAQLNGTDLYTAQLNGANLIGTQLKDAVLAGTDLTGATYAPASAPPAAYVAGIKGLETVIFPLGQEIGLVQLRKLLQDGGLREERQATYALERNRTRHLLFPDFGKPGFKAENQALRNLPWRDLPWRDPLVLLEAIFRLVLFEGPVAYGLYPGQALLILFGFIGVFAVVYLVPLSSNGIGGIHRIWPKGRLEARWWTTEWEEQIKVERLHPQEWWQRLGIALQFSILSAFHLGWRELNVGTWLGRLQGREYSLQATGWVRTVAGIQSLLSVYLLALWVLTYFGRPFG